MNQDEESWFEQGGGAIVPRGNRELGAGLGKGYRKKFGWGKVRRMVVIVKGILLGILCLECGWMNTIE